jgi:pSer/pThr/pTyr-binding forkhead associated (FHA) protein
LIMQLPLSPGVLRDLQLTLTVLDDDGEPCPVEADLTIGRQLDNDLIVAGEDVADFHARVELGQRSVQLIPLGTATASVNGAMLEGRTGLMPGDEILLGTHLIVLRAESAVDQPGQWRLHPAAGEDSVTVGMQLTVGRGSDCGLRLNDKHVSRHHAMFQVLGGVVWLRDLQSANGTFVNGDRVRGACRLFHGDVVSFDSVSYQLIGDDPDLTPVMPFDPSLVRPARERLVDSTRNLGGGSDPSLSRSMTRPESVLPQAAIPETAQPGHTVELGPDEVEALLQAGLPPEVAEPLPSLEPDRAAPNRPALVALSGELQGQSLPLSFGRHLIGRDSAAAIRLEDEAVSSRHAELDVRADGIFITNLMATNGTLVNARPVHTARLQPGDHLRIGRTLFVVRGARAPLNLAARLRQWPPEAGVAIAGGIVVLGLLGLLWWLLL